MELKLYDTLTREKRVFPPLDPARVRMYVCGPTVYDFAHIGNARPVIVFDVLFRLLRHLYGADHVTYVRNITDVDDKINARAAEEYPDLPLNEAIRIVTEKTEKQFHEDVDALGCLPPDRRAARDRAHRRDAPTTWSLIERLVAGGHAYVAEEHVLFGVSSMPDYGRLSQALARRDDRGRARRGRALQARPDGLRAVEAVEAGRAGVAVARGIATPGRPGWHIECSAMSWKHPRRDLRHPRRRHRPRVSAPRERDRAIALRLPHAGDGELSGCTTASCRSKARRCRRASGNFVTIRELLTNDWRLRLAR